MIGFAVIAASALLASVIATPSTTYKPVRLQPDARSGFCLSVFTARQPQAGDAIQLSYCDGPNYQATLRFNVPASEGESGSIKYSNSLCLQADSDDNGAKPVLGDCSAQWTIGNDGTIRSPANQCLNIAEEDSHLQTWECDSADPQSHFTIEDLA